MSKTELYVDGVQVPVVTDISIPTTYAISDVEDPSKRDSNITLPISIPSNIDIDRVFEFIHNPNRSLQTFNPHLKTPVIFKNYGVTVLEGNLKLNKVVLNKGRAFYECDVKGLLSDLFYSIGETFLTDLDFSAYDHAISKANVSASWAVTAGSGYVYPIMDLGYPLSGVNAAGQFSDFYCHQLRACLFVKEYIDKIFAAAGKTYTSTFFNTAFFKSLIIPGCEPVVISDADFFARQFRGNIQVNQVHSTALTYSGGFWDAAQVLDDVFYPDDSTFPNQDSGAQWNTGTSVLTVAADGYYTLTAQVWLDLDFTCSALPFPGTASGADLDYSCTIQLQKFISGTWTTVESGTTKAATGASSGDPAGQYVVTKAGFFTAGDLYRVKFLSDFDNVIIYDGVMAPVTTGTATYNLIFSNSFINTPYDSFISLVLDNDFVREGDSVVASQLIPKEVKQKDFLKSIIQMFHLMVLEDKSDRNNYFIEPRINFFSAATQDWTSKIDISQSIEIEPIDFSKFYSFTYKEDVDFYNKRYQDDYKEVYGFYKYEAQTEFNNDENKTEIIFSPTPAVGNNYNRLRIPAIYKNENSVVEPLKFNPRILQWGGMKAGSWNFKSNSGDDYTNTSYPYAGMVDDPFTPTIDLCFDNPKELFYAEYPVVTYTNNNLGSIYHLTYLDQLSHKDARLIKMYMNINEVDIKKFDFRDKKFIDGSVCVVNAIRDFDILEAKTTLVEFLKL